MSDFSRCLAVNGQWEQSTGKCKSKITGMTIFSPTTPWVSPTLTNPYVKPAETKPGLTNPWFKPQTNNLLEAYKKQKELDAKKSIVEDDSKTDDSKTDDSKKRKTWKDLKTRDKVGIIAGSVIVVGILTWLIVRKK